MSGNTFRSWSHTYAPVSLEPGQLARVLQEAVEELASGIPLHASIVRMDSETDELSETHMGGELGELGDVCALGSAPHGEVSVIWNRTESPRGMFINLSLNNSGSTLYVIISAEETRTVNGLARRLEHGLGLKEPAERKTRPSFPVIPEPRAHLPTPTSAADVVLAREMAKVDREGTWKVRVAIIGAAALIAGAVIAALRH